MATYKGIKGVKVVTKTADPTASEATGTVWYNSTGDALKYSIQSAGAWASGNAVNTGRVQFACFGHTQTAAIIASGYIANTSTYVAIVEEYDGTSWTEVGNVNTMRRICAGSGTAAAGLISAGLLPPPGANTNITEVWNGTSWTEVNQMTVTRRGGSTSELGTTTATLYATGEAPGGLSVATESYDGTSWTELGGDVNTAREHGAGAGTLAAAILMGGQSPVTSNTETWDGTSWTEVNPLNEAKIDMGSAGTQATAMVFGGAPARATTESYDGTSWTEVADLSTARYDLAGAGTFPAALAFSGQTNSTTAVTATEEWNDPSYTIKTVTVS